MLRLDQIAESGRSVVKDTTLAGGVPGLEIRLSRDHTPYGAKLGADEVSELRDVLNDWLLERGR